MEAPQAKSILNSDWPSQTFSLKNNSHHPEEHQQSLLKSQEHDTGVSAQSRMAGAGTSHRLLRSDGRSEFRRAYKHVARSRRVDLIRSSGTAESTNEMGGCSRDLVLAGLDALDLVDVGVAITDGHGKVLFTNQVAHKMCKAHDGIHIAPDGALVTSAENGCRPLAVCERQLSKENRNGVPRMKAGVEAVPRGEGKRPLTIVCRPLTAAKSTSGSSDSTYALFMLDPERPVQVNESGLRELYDFTATEARLAQLLMSGKTFAECSEQLQVRESTARMHLGSLFAKTGVRRQGQLVSLLLKSLGAICTKQNVSVSSTQCNPVMARRTEGSEAQRFGATGILSAGLEALDWIDIGVVVINHVSQVLFMNQRAGKILAMRDGLEVTPHGALAPVRKIRTSSLNPSFKSCLPVDTVLSLQRAGGKRPITLIVRSLNEAKHKSDAQRPFAVAFLLDPELPEDATESRLRTIYGFTASEARLGRLLVEGKTIDDCCKPLNIRASTARRHLANIFAKTDVRHQGQLISLLLKSVGLIRVDDRISSVHSISDSPVSDRSVTSLYIASSTSPRSARA